MMTPTNPDRMPRKLKAYASLWCILCLGLIVSPGPALAGNDALQQLYAEALLLDGVVRQVELHNVSAQADASGASGSLLELYIASETSSRILQSVSVSIDGAPPRRYEYSEEESTALQRGGLHPLLRQLIPAGTHRIQVKFIARKYGATGNQRTVARFDNIVALRAPLARLEVCFTDRGFLNLFRGASVKLRQWSEAS